MPQTLPEKVGLEPEKVGLEASQFSAATSATELIAAAQLRTSGLGQE